jgi:hypothetical protein
VAMSSKRRKRFPTIGAVVLAVAFVIVSSFGCVVGLDVCLAY